MANETRHALTSESPGGEPPFPGPVDEDTILIMDLSYLC